MKTIDITVAKRKYSFTAPERWEEVRQDQFIAYCKTQRARYHVEPLVLAAMLDMPDNVAVYLMPADWYAIGKEFEWLLDVQSLDVNIIDKVDIANVGECLAPDADFSNVTWEEFMFCDHFAENQSWATCMAVLFRPEKKDWDGESERRIPYTKQGTERRLPGFMALGEDVQNAFGVQYTVMRKRMTDKYPRLFVDAGDDEEENGKKTKRRKKHSWLSTIREMMSEHFWEEEKFLRLPVNSVLFQMNKAIIDNEKLNKKK